MKTFQEAYAEIDEIAGKDYFSMGFDVVRHTKFANHPQEIECECRAWVGTEKFSGTTWDAVLCQIKDQKYPLVDIRAILSISPDLEVAA